MTLQNAINRPVRRVGFVMPYTGNDNADVFGINTGWLQEYDGRWVYLTSDSFRTIGSATSGANLAANWLQTLFIHFWNQYQETPSPDFGTQTTINLYTSTGTLSTKGTSAIADWTANKRLEMPDFRGRLIASMGSGNGLTSRGKGNRVGAETHTLSINEMPSHSHTPSGGIWATQNSQFNLTGSGSSFANANVALPTVGGGQAHNNMQPTVFEHFLISAGVR